MGEFDLILGNFGYSQRMRENDWIKLLGWPGYRVYRHEIDEQGKTLKLWVRRKRGNRKLVCSGCGVKTEKIAQLPSKAPFSQRLEEAVGLACESATVRRGAQQFGLAASTVRTIDLRYLKRWAAGRRKPALRQMGVDEIHLGKKQKFLTVVSNLETGEPLWFGRERKPETLDQFFAKPLSSFQRSVMGAACVDRWEPFRQSRKAVVAAVPDRIGQVPHHAACRCGGG